MLKSGKRYELHDPTYSEVKTFLNLDKTDRIYDEGFVCRHYAQHLNNNAEEQGIRCAYVHIDLSGGKPHACIAFNVTYQGIIYFEPSNDWKVVLRLTKDYFADCIVCPSGYYYKRDPDCIVEDFELFW